MDAERTSAAHLAGRVGAWSWDPVRRHVHLDPVARTLLGFEPGAVVTPEEYFSRVHDEDRDRVRESLTHAALSGEPEWGEYRFTRSDGQSVWVQNRSETLEDGRLHGVLIDTTPLHDPTTHVRLGGPLQQGKWLSTLTDALSRALTLHDVATVVHEHGQQVLGAAFAGLLTLDESAEALTFVRSDVLPVETKLTWSTYPLSRNSPGADVVRERRPRVFSTPERLLEAYPHLEDDVTSLGIHAWAGFPMVASDRPTGALVLFWSGERTFNDSDLLDLGTAAAACAQAVERARLYERQQEVALTMQRAVLPETLPSVPGLDVAARYLPAESGLEVGGDWYDAFPLPDGEVMLVIGDTTGHGLEAAGAMGQLRNAVRAYALEGYGPALVLTKLNRLLSLLGEDVYASVLLASYDAQTGRIRWANAGHLPPVVECGGSATLLEEVHDPLVGALSEYEYTEVERYVDAGSTLMLYSDGLVEERTEDVTRSIEVLAQIAATPWHTTLDVHCTRVMEQVLGNRQRVDDLCLLMVRRRTEDQHHAEATFARDLESPREARRFLVETLAAWGASELEDPSLLLLSEVVTNAVVHASSAPRVTLALDGTALVVSVHDESPLPPIRRRFGLDTSNGRGVGLVDTLASQWGVDQTPGGKDVWFQVERTSDEEAGAKLLALLGDELEGLDELA